MITTLGIIPMKMELCLTGQHELKGKRDLSVEISSLSQMRATSLISTSGFLQI